MILMGVIKKKEYFKTVRQILICEYPLQSFIISLNAKEE